MKKTLVAIAALTAVSAFAQSTVTISGNIDSAYKIAKTTFGDGGTRTVNSVSHSDQNTSNVTFKGVEDIGGGVKGLFLYELDMSPIVGGSLSTQPDNKDQIQNGETYVGVETSAGTIKFGSPNTPSLSVQAGRSPFGTKAGGGFGSTSGSGRVRTNGSIVLSTPTFSGFTATYSFTPATSAKATPNYATAAAEVKSITDLGLAYANGPVAAGLSMYSQSGTNKSTNGYVSYTIGAAKLTYGMHNEEHIVAPAAATAPAVSLAAGKYSGNNLAASYTMGQIDLLANFGKLNDKTSNNNDRKITAVGAKYNFSKRTNAYVRIVNDKLDNVTGATLNAKINTTLVGLAHAF